MRERHLENGFFLALLVLTTLAFFGLLRDFLMPIFWAVVLAVLFHPVYRRLLAWVGGRAAVASLATILIILLAVILPLTLIGVAVSREAVGLYQRIAAGEVDLEAPVRTVEQWAPMVAEQLERLGVDLDRLRGGLSNVAVGASSWIASQALAIGQDALRFFVLFVLMVYVLFFFLRDGDRLLDAVVRALPLGDVRERRLISKFAEVTRATIKGTLVVAGVQGALGGILFWALGLPAAAFWGVVMGVLSFLPAVGSGLVWVPAAIILIATGSIARGVILAAGGTLVIGLVDNFLRPILVGRDTQMPDFLILLSTLGGLAVFGISGVVIGPVVAAFFLVAWDIFASEFKHQDDWDASARAEPAASSPGAAEAPPGGEAESAVPVRAAPDPPRPGPVPPSRGAGPPSGEEA